MYENDAQRGLREAREYANKLLAGEGSHQQFSDLTNVILCGMREDPEFDIMDSDQVVKMAIGR